MIISLGLLNPVMVAAQGAAKKNQTQKSQQKPEPNDTVQLTAELITIPFTVSDQGNRYVNNLSKDQIRVLEDGKEQEIFSFTLEADLDLKYALVVDTSNSQQNTLGFAKAAAQRFFQTSLHPRDTAAIFSFQHTTALLQPMTSDTAQITRAVSHIGDDPPSSQGGTALYDALYITADDVFTRGNGRQVLILLTDGFDYDSSVEAKEAIDRAVRAEAIVYAIGIGDSFNFGGINTKVLTQLATATGGRAFYPHRDSNLDDAFRQIQTDLRQRYIISYSSNNPVHDGSFRSIKVEVKSHPEYTVRFRHGYYAAEDQPAK